MAYKRFKIDKGDHYHMAQECEPYYIGTKLMTHKSIEPPCAFCHAAGDMFLDMHLVRGGFYLEERMARLASYRAYAQKWPFDLREMVLSSEVVFDGTSIYVEGHDGQSTLEQMMDYEAVEELLYELTLDERFVIDKTVEGYRPRDIAKLRGDKVSDRVRQLKYAALRKLGAPVNKHMRRVP